MGRVFRSGHHQAVAANQDARLGRGAQQAVQAVAVVVVDLAAVGPDRLEAQLLAIDFMADAINVVAQVVAEGGGDFEVFLEAFPQTETIK